MDCSDIAEKYGIKEYLPEFFSDKCLKFYSKNDIERIKESVMPLTNLQFAGYEYDEDYKYYTKTKDTECYEFNGKKYELYKYENCFIYYVFLCNAKLKKFRYVEMIDNKEFAENEVDDVYVYKDKYYCHYYKAIKSLLFFNRNEFIRLPSLPIMADLKKTKASEFISKYFEIKNMQGQSQQNIAEFYVADDEAILSHFDLIYQEIMKDTFKIENPTIYKNIIEKDEEDIEKLNNISDIDKCALKIYYLHGHEEYRNFCNNICDPETYRKELLKNGEVRKNLKNNFWIFHEFKSSLRDPNNDFIEGEDFTFLIINAIKSLEYLLYRKIKNYESFRETSNNDEISERAMLDALIYYVQKHKEMFKIPSESIISKNNFDSYVESYIKLLYYVKDECRNGYFHKHRIDNYDNLCKKRDKVMEAIAKTIIFLK